MMPCYLSKQVTALQDRFRDVANAFHYTLRCPMQMAHTTQQFSAWLDAFSLIPTAHATFAVSYHP